MKKRTALLVMLLLLGALVLFLPFRQRKPDLRPWTHKYTFISPFANNGYWGNAAHGIAQADEAYGCHTKFVSFSGAEEGEIAGAILAAVYEDCDGIIAWGNKSPVVTAAMEQARQKQIPIVLIDGDNPEVDRLCYIGTNNYEAGRLAGQDLCEGVTAPLHILAFIGSETAENQELRLSGFREALEGFPSCSLDLVVESGYSTLKVKEQLPQILQGHPEINAIFCAEGYSSAITGEVLRSLGPAGERIRVVVFDQSEDILSFIRDGRYHASIVQQSDRMGAEAIRILEEWYQGKAPEQDVLYTEAISVKKENLDQVRRYESEGVIWHLFNRNLKVIRSPES